MKILREKFEKMCGIKGYVNEEKDSEEFLSLLLDKLKSDPLLKFR